MDPYGPPTLADVLMRNALGGPSAADVDPRLVFRNPLMEVSRQRFAPFPSLPALPPRGEMRNPDPRPGDAMAPVAETLSPTMGAYGLGSLAGDTYLKAREGDIAGAALNVPGLMLAAAPIPGAKRVPGTQIAERPVAAAIRYNGEIFTGLHHGDAAAKAMQKYGAAAEQAIYGDKNILADIDGFITDRGRYVSRAEATALAKGMGLERGRQPGGLADSYDINDLNKVPNDRTGSIRDTGPIDHPLLRPY